ncbi:MAG: electron transport complex subunit RsxB [Rubrivivax sp.]|nr:electron transport complex subunit RsxB [Rubrivivax sp.]
MPPATQPAAPAADTVALAARLDDALPQTQCTRCGFPDCSGYAVAMARGEADLDRCPPGGAEGIARLAAITGWPQRPLDPLRGAEGPLRLAVIDEAWCIGCTLCIQACPVDCIVGASRRMHTVVEAECTGCELCVPACPVDCIEMRPASGERTGWQAWSDARAARARERYGWHRERVARERRENDERLAAKAAAKLADLGAASSIADAAVLAGKRAVIEAALARARARRSDTAGPSVPSGQPTVPPDEA